jgi:hypothetical protein
VGLSVVGYVFGLRALLDHGILTAGGAGGGDVFAYWTAGRHILDGQPVYGAGVGGYASFLYPPPLAQGFAPLALLPFPVATWIWRAVDLACLRIAVGSWRSAGVALIALPPVLAEIDAGNVHLLIAAAVAMAIRGDARALGPVALTKFASLAAVPMGWRGDRRGLLIGVATAAAILVGSFALAPDLWVAYARFLPSVPNQSDSWYNLGATVPLALRLGAAAALSLAAVRWARLAAVAATLAVPVLWFHSLSILVAAVSKPRRISVTARHDAIDDGAATHPFLGAT